jgi:hypothetical protein
LAPPVVERPGEDGAEQRAHLGAGEEVAAPPRAAAAAVEAELGVVEGEVDDLVERERTEPPGPLADEVCYLTSDATSPRWAKSCG